MGFFWPLRALFVWRHNISEWLANEGIGGVNGKKGKQDHLLTITYPS